MNKTTFLPIDLQLFADGAAAAGDTGAADTGGTGDTASAAGMRQGARKSAKNPLADVIYGKQDTPQDASAGKDTAAPGEGKRTGDGDKSAAFEKMIRGEYKDEFGARVQKIVSERLKDSKDAQTKLERQASAISAMAAYYGLDAEDYEGITRAIDNDSRLWEEEADRAGIPVEKYREFKKTERENAQLRRQMDDIRAKEEAARTYAGWMEQAEAAKKFYPSLDLNAEIGNAQFMRLLRGGVDVRTAYEVVHRDDIYPAIMEHTAKQVEEKITNNIAAKGTRPVENGAGGTSAAVIRNDVSQFTKADRDEIRRRVARGEKIIL